MATIYKQLTEKANQILFEPQRAGVLFGIVVGKIDCQA
jgi:hypothetical protein